MHDQGTHSNATVSIALAKRGLKKCDRGLQQPHLQATAFHVLLQRRLDGSAKKKRWPLVGSARLCCSFFPAIVVEDRLPNAFFGVLALWRATLAGEQLILDDPELLPIVKPKLFVAGNGA